MQAVALFILGRRAHFVEILPITSLSNRSGNRDMTKIAYIKRDFSAGSLATIAKANEIIKEYTDAGYTLTLRQLYYQFVARDLIPNKQSEYKRLGSVLNDGRLAGLIDWEAMEDRVRNLEKLATWDSPSDILNAVAQQFRFDRWEDQDWRVEVWIEKDALGGVVGPVCEEFRVPYLACRGYMSQSEAWAAGQRFRKFQRRQRVLVLHLGDHDPSGVDMSRDNEDRLNMFAPGAVKFKRIALNMNQIEEYDPPPNPVKDTDSRNTGYRERFGDECWELDALDPKVIGAMLRTEFRKVIDKTKWQAAEEREGAARGRLSELAQDWED
jgi:hypothetical protein